MIEDRNAARNAISSFCRNNLYKSMSAHLGIGMVPNIVVVFLGEESRNALSGMVKEEIGTLLDVDPGIEEICLNEHNATGTYFKEEIDKAIQRFGDKFKLVAGSAISINVVYVSLMHDPFFNNVNVEEVLNSFRETTMALTTMHISFKQTTFYGLFDLRINKMQHDYSGAFRFINIGNTPAYSLWKEIYHLETGVVRSTFEMECRTVSMQILFDSMFPAPGGHSNIANSQDEYAWKAIGFYELKVPEQMLCRLLIDGFNKQRLNRAFTPGEMEDFADELKEYLMAEMKKNMSVLTSPEIVTYLPQPPEQVFTQEVKKGLFGFRKKKQEQAAPQQRTITEEQIQNLLVNTIQEQMDKTMKAILKAIEDSFHSMTQIDINKVQLANTLIEICRKTQVDVVPSDTPIFADTFEQYRAGMYDKVADITAAQAVNYGLQQYLKDEESTAKFRSGLNSIIDHMYDDLKNVLSVLDELRVNLYGDAIYAEQKYRNEDYGVLHIGDNIKQACERVSKEKLGELIAKEGMREDNLNDFYSTATMKANELQQMGSVYGDHHASPVLMTLLTREQTPPLPNGKSIINDVFLPNTLQILAYCSWPSQYCLSNYFEVKESTDGQKE